MWNCCFPKKKKNILTNACPYCNQYFEKKKDLYKHKETCIYNPYELIQYRELK
jgi:hypothetical protein